MIDTSSEQVIPLSQAARETPNRRGTKGVNAATPWRWAMRGVNGIRLETVCIGGQRMTSREAMCRFFSAVTAAANGTPAPNVATTKQRQRAIAAAERELKDAGI